MYRYCQLVIMAIAVSAMAACAPAAPQVTAVPIATETASAEPTVVSEGVPFTDYKSALDATDLPRQELDPAFRPLDLHGDEYASIGEDGEVYLIGLPDGQRTQITSDGLPKINAVLSGEHIAWLAQQGEVTVRLDGEDSQFALYDVFVQNRQTGEQRRITRETAPRAGLAIDRDRLVWMDRRNELEAHYNDYDIYAYDLATDTEFTIAVAPGAQQAPSIHGDLIVWQDNRNSAHKEKPLAGCGNCPENRYDIYLYDFRTQTSRAIVEDEWLKSNPSVYGNRVAWEGYTEAFSEEFSGGWADLYLLELDTGLFRRLTRTPDPETNPVLSQDHVLWIVRFACDVGGGPQPDNGVYVLDLTTEELQKLSGYVEPVALLDQTTAVIVEACQAGFEAYAVAID